MSRTDTGPQRGLPMPMRGALGSTAPVERTRNFGAVALRMLRRLRPQRAAVTAVLALSVAGIVISAIGPRILGHATDLLFDGVVGARLPAGIDKAQAVADARARGDDAFADMLASMNVVPGHGVDFAAVARTLTLALGLYLIAALLIWVQARLLNVILQRTLAALRADVAAKIHRMPLSAFDSRPRGELLSRVTNDVDNIATSVSMTVNQLLSSMLTLLAVLAMMLTISPMLTLIAVATVPLSLWATRAITRRSRKLFVAQWRNTGRLNAHIEETYTGFTVVRTYGHRDAARDRFAELNGDVYRAGRQAQFLSGLIGPATTFVGNISYVAVAVVGGIQVATGQLSLGGIQAFIQYVRQFNQPLSQVAGMYNTLQSGLASAERVFELLDEPEMGPEPAGRLPGPRGSAPQIRFEDLGFGYRPGRPVLQSVTLTAEPGTTVAIVGPTGAGKTTLVNLLMRFYEPDAGRICFDGTDIAGVHRSELRSRMAMVLQDTWLFDGTIAENIAYGRPDDGSEPNEDDIREAARSAFVDGFVSALPHGYHTRVGDGGGLSAGERQLITIARAFMARPDVLILDEATSSVDTRTELVIQQAMAELRRDRTCFVIAHRLSTIRDADLIVVLEAGRIVEQGSHTELLARRGAYWAMVQASR